MNRLRLSKAVLVALAAAFFVMVTVPSATAVHDLGLFELDANAVDEAAAGDDWNTLVGGGGSADFFNMIQDPVESPGDDIFDGGQTKDTTDIDSWKWKGAEPNDKNDIQHAFTAAYENPVDGHTIVYFGLDRLDSSGDAAAGFWFLKKPVEQKTVNGNEIFVYKGTNTPAEHSVGDFLVQTDFTNGGIVERIDAYAWGIAPLGTEVQPGSPLRLIAEGADCDAVVEPPELCGQVNDGGEAVPANWPGSPTGTVKFKGPGGVVNTNVFNDATFMEGGVDLTSLFGKNVCVAQFIAETRQSQSETAVLDDKVEGGFDLCKIKVTKTGPEKSKVSDDASYEIKIENVGAVTLYKQSIQDSLQGNLTAALGCGASLAPGASCTITYDRTVQAGDPDPLVNTVNVVYNRDSNLAGDTATASDDHSVNLFQPSIELSKTGDALSKIGDKVDYTITLKNTSSADSPDLACEVSDPTVKVLEKFTIASGDSKVINVNDFEIPAGAADPFVNTAAASCSPVGFPNILTAKASHTTNLFQPAIALEKTGDALSKIGDKVDYVITLANKSSADTPDLECTISDATVGVNETGIILASGQQKVVNVNDFPIPNNAADPFVNKASASCSPSGFPNVFKAEDSWETNLFQPAISLEKKGDPLSKIGDKVDYVITLTNLSSADSPALECTISDPTVGVNETGIILAPGQQKVVNVNDFPIPNNAADPFVNKASVSCSPSGFPNVITAEASHSTNLFQPEIKLEKTGDALSKIGDEVTYTITLTNASSGDTPELACKVVDEAIKYSKEVKLASGAKEVLQIPFTIPAGAADPFPNKATATCSPSGFPNVLTAEASHSINLFQPEITLEKTGDELSKIGDTVDYVITLVNKSSADTPELVCTVTDAKVGVNESGIVLASGGQKVVNVNDFVIPNGASDPFVNTAGASCSPKGFPNVLKKEASWKTNLFQPAIKVVKEAGNPYSKAGDPVRYKVTIANASSTDSPDLEIDKITDSLQGDLTSSANYDTSTCGASLASGASCEIAYTRTVLGGDPDPLENTVSVETHPAAFPNDVDASASVKVDLLHPAYTVTKDCKAGTEPVPQEGPAVFTITFTNTSNDTDLVITADDGVGTFDLAAGASKSFTTSLAGPFSGQATVENTVNSTAVLAAKYGLPNKLAKDATGDCRVAGRASLLKTTQGGNEPVGGWTFKLYSGPDGFDAGTLLATDNTPPPLLDFGNINLDPTKAYTICEENVPAGWTSLWKVDTNGDGTADTIINPYNPNADDTPMADVGNRCIDFGAGTDFAIPAGGTLAFQVDNSFPGGEPRTPGYWKNWSSCTGGGQYQNAINRGGGPAGFWTLDELLNNPGFKIGDMVLNGVWNDDPFKYQNAPLNNDCVEAVRILDKSDAGNAKKKASDAAYELATMLLAAKLNLAAGAESCQAVLNAVGTGQQLLDDINFTGTGDYLGSKVTGALLAKRTQALALASTLDQYNNGNLC